MRPRHALPAVLVLLLLALLVLSRPLRRGGVPGPAPAPEPPADGPAVPGLPEAPAAGSGDPAAAGPAEDPEAARDEWEPRRFSGRVLLPDGSPAAGAEVYHGGRFDPMPPVEWREGGSGNLAPRLLGFATCDGDGRYRTLAAPDNPGGPPFDHPSDHQVLAVLGNRLASAEPVEAGDGTWVVPDLVLAGGFRIRGRVVDSAGDPVEGAMAWLDAARGPRTDREFRRLVARSDADGRLDFLPLADRPDWSLSLSLRHVAYPPLELRLDPAAAASGRPFEWTLPRGAVLRGRVTGPDDAPRAGVQVVPAVSGRDGWRGIEHLVATTDADGRFEMPVVPAGTVRLLLYPDLDAPVGSRGATGAIPHEGPTVDVRPGQDLELGTARFGACGSIRGVVHGSDGGPLGDASVRLRALAARASRHAFSDERGRFTFPDLPPGAYRIEAGGEESGDAVASSVEVLPGRESAVEIALSDRD